MCIIADINLIYLSFVFWVKRITFDYEKGLNIEKVEQLKAMEPKLIGMAREVEKLHAEVLNAEKRASGNSFLLYNMVVIVFFSPFTITCFVLILVLIV